MFLLPGWGESEGVEIEIEAAEALGSGTTYSETLEKFTGVTPAQSAELHRGISGSVSYKSCAQCMFGADLLNESNFYVAGVQEHCDIGDISNV